MKRKLIEWKIRQQKPSFLKLIPHNHDQETRNDFWWKWSWENDVKERTLNFNWLCIYRYHLPSLTGVLCLYMNVTSNEREKSSCVESKFVNVLSQIWTQNPSFIRPFTFVKDSLIYNFITKTSVLHLFYSRRYLLSSLNLTDWGAVCFFDLII